MLRFWQAAFVGGAVLASVSAALCGRDWRVPIILLGETLAFCGGACWGVQAGVAKRLQQAEGTGDGVQGTAVKPPRGRAKKR